MNIDKFEEDMQVFTFGQHQDFLNYNKMLKKQGYTFNDAERYVSEVKRRSEERIKIIESFYKSCPLCQSNMILLPVNINRETKTTDNSKSVWFCKNKDCLETIYNKENIDTITRKRGKASGR